MAVDVSNSTPSSEDVSMSHSLDGGNIPAEDSESDEETLSASSHSDQQLSPDETPDNENTDNTVDEYFEENTVREKAKRFCIKHNLTYRAVGDFLSFLNNLPKDFPPLPKSYVTLMETPKGKISTRYVPPGEYYHIGLKVVAQEIAKMPNTPTNTGMYHIVLHIDGVSLSDSSNLEAWTISGAIDELKNLDPFLIGVYVGKRTPKDFDLLLEDLANDISIGRSEGFEINESSRYFFYVKYIVADAPARSKLTHTMGHNALHGCPYCSQIGFKEVDIPTQFAPRIVEPLTTDEGFRKRENLLNFNETHRSKVGVLETAQVKMVSQVVPCAMHSWNLGAMKKILRNIFQKKGYSINYKFTNEQLEELSRRYESLAQYHPCDFTRYPRSIIDNLPHLKAVECRYILHYYGKLIFKDIMPPEMYEHFLFFSLSARMFSDPASNYQGISMAQTLIEKFVYNFSTFYGYERTYVIHTLLHYKQYVQMYGPLYSFSAYRFENYLRFFKKIVRAKHHVLQQIRNRVTEQGILRNRHKDPNGILDRSFIKNENDFALFSTYVLNDLYFKTDEVNCFAKISENQTYHLVKIVKFKRSIEHRVTTFEYKKIKIIGPFFNFQTMGLDSCNFDIYECEPTEMEQIHEAPLSSILCKLIATPLEWCAGKRIVQKMSHSSDEQVSLST